MGPVIRNDQEGVKSNIISQSPSQGFAWSHHLWPELPVFTPVGDDYFLLVLKQSCCEHTLIGC